MPKFVAALSEDDDEVVILPYVKPPPPMIDLLGSDDEEGHIAESPSHSAQQTKESESRSVSSAGDHQARRNDSSLTGIVESQGEPTISQNFSVNSPLVRSLFDPSEAAMTDVPSKQATPSGSVESTPVPSPGSSIGQPTPGKRGKGRANSHSSLVKKQFEEFLKGINLPPSRVPVPRAPRKPRTRSTRVASGGSEQPIGTAESGASPFTVLPTGDGFVSVTMERSKSTPVAKRTRARKPRSVPVATVVSQFLSPEKITNEAQESNGAMDTHTMDIQFNRTTSGYSEVPRPDPKAKGKKRTKTTEKEPSTKKRKQDETKKKDPTTPKRKTKEKSKKDDTMTLTSPRKSTPRKKTDTITSTSTAISAVIDDAGMPSHWNDEMKKFYGTISSSPFKVEAIWAKQPKHAKHWRTEKDGVPYRGSKRREPCDFCKRFDHRPVHCPRRGCPMKCVYCAGDDHTKDACSAEGVCLFCGSERTVIVRSCKTCFDRSKPALCNLCSLRGHSADMCPDNWRRYHSITIDIEQVQKRLQVVRSRLGQLKKRESMGACTSTDTPELILKRKIGETASSISEQPAAQSPTPIAREIEKLRRERDELTQKLSNQGRVTVGNSNPYVPKYKQYCCNCAAKGHAYINCTKKLPDWANGCQVIPNKPYVIKEMVTPTPERPKKTKRIKNVPATTTDTAFETNRDNTGIGDSVSTETQPSATTDRAVTGFDDDDDDVTFITIVNTRANVASTSNSANEKNGPSHITITNGRVSNDELQKPSSQVRAGDESQPNNSSFGSIVEPNQRKVVKDRPTSDGSVADHVTTSMKVTIANDTNRNQPSSFVSSTPVSIEVLPKEAPKEAEVSASIDDGTAGLRSQITKEKENEVRSADHERQSTSKSADDRQTTSKSADDRQTTSKSADDRRTTSKSADKERPTSRWDDPRPRQPTSKSADQLTSLNVNATPSAQPILPRSADSEENFHEDVSTDALEGNPDVGGFTVPRHPLFQPSRIPFPPPQPLMSHPLFGIPPPRPAAWRQGFGPPTYRFPPSNFGQPPPRVEVIQIPVPVPVREEDYARFQREGFPPQFQFQKFLPPPPLMSLGNPFAPYQQIPPPHFTPWTSPRNTTVQPPCQPTKPADTASENPPSPDSTETPITNAPMSPEIVFLEEVSNPKPAATSPEDPDEIKISLLPSEWDYFGGGKGRADLITTLSNRLGVSIKVCRETMVVSITGPNESRKALAKRNIVEFLQKEAAGITFVPDLNLPEDPIPKPKEPEKNGPSNAPNSPRLTQQQHSQNNGDNSNTSQRNPGGRDESRRYAPYPTYPRHGDSRNWSYRDHGRDYDHRRNYHPSNPYRYNREDNSRDAGRREYGRRGDHRDHRGHSDRNYRGGRDAGTSSKEHEPPRPNPRFDRPRRYFE